MTIVKTTDSLPYIPISFFEICQEDGKTRTEICKLYKKEEVTTHSSCYFLQKFEYHLKNLGITLKDYIKKHLQEEWPKCPINGEEVNINQLCGKGVIISRFKATVTKETSVNFRNACEKMSKERMGENNPMYGATPWNKNLTAKTNEVIQKMAENALGRVVSEETKEKFREARRLSPIKARHTQKHSPETCERFREITAKRWQNGSFNKETSIHRITREFLQKLNFTENWEEEFNVKYYSLDFAFPESKIAIECQGTFFHIDPRFYPNGPENAIQRRNFGRDKAKRSYLENKGWTLIEIWETEINNGEFKDYLKCKLKKLGVLKV